MSIFCRRREPQPAQPPAPTEAAPLKPTRSAPFEAGVPRPLVKFGLGAWYTVGILLIIAAIVLATAKIVMVFVAVFLAFVVTAVLHPGVDKLDEFMPRPLATGLSLVGLVGVFGAMVYYVVMSVSSEWDDLADSFSSGIDTIIKFLEDGPLPWTLTHEQITNGISELADKGTNYVRQNAGDLAGQVMANASTFALIMTILALSFFATIFFLASGREMWLWFLNLVPGHNRLTTHKAAVAGWTTFSGYARGTVIVALADGAMAFVLLLILGVPLAAPLAVLVFIGAFIPLIGAPAAMIVATIVSLAANGPVNALFVLLGIALIGQFEGHVLQPLVMGKQVSLHPVVVALAVASGTFVAGLLGAVIATPIVAVAWAVYKVLSNPDEPLKELPEVDAHALIDA